MRISDWSSEVCSSDLRKASPVAKRKAGDLRRLPQLAHENRALLVQNACVEVEQCNQLIDFVVAKPPILQLAHNLGQLHCANAAGVQMRFDPLRPRLFLTPGPDG